MISMAGTTPSHAGSEIIERILAAGSGLIVMNCADTPALIEQIGRVARHSGQAVYLWQPDSGLSSLREAHSRVPDCVRLGNALRYMQQSLHFGVYFLGGLELPLSSADAGLLRQLAQMTGPHVRRVVLLDPPDALSEHLGELAEHLDDVDRRPRRLRLRDGRWMA